jgi:hypothetical protein
VRWIGRSLVALVVVVVVGVGGGSLWVSSSLPVTDGRVTVTGPSAAIRITRDVNGVPTIRAADDRDAAFALGYLHAQDRLFQMDLMRRAGAGRLAEILGPVALPIDRMMRTYGIYAAAQKQIAGLSKATQESLDGYAAGVNAYIAQRHAGILCPAHASGAVAGDGLRRLEQADGFAACRQFPGRIVARPATAAFAAGNARYSFSVLSVAGADDVERQGLAL